MSPQREQTGARQPFTLRRCTLLLDIANHQTLTEERTPAMSITVTTQQALDDAIAAGHEDIVVDSPRGVWVTVHASDSATVHAYGSATVRAYGSATVRATPKVAVHLHSGCCTIAGGVLIDHTIIDLTDPQTWCDYHGVPTVDGIATVHKAVDDDWTTGRGTDYRPGATPSAPDWRDDHECGGGLHFSPHPWQAREYMLDASRFVAVGVAVADLRPILGATPKCKAPRVVSPCVEVTIDGTPTNPES